MHAGTMVLIGGLAALGLGLFAAAAESAVGRPLLELGRIEMPGGLEPRAPDETPERVIFRFERVADSFFLMGSNTPIRERLTVVAWPADVPQRWEREFIGTAVERTGDMRWRDEGSLRIGEGIHRVNTHETPAWVLVTALPGANIRIGYMVWQRDATLAQAKATLARAAASFARAMPQEQFFAVVRARPARLAGDRRAALAQALGQRNVALVVDGPPVVQNEAFYLLRGTAPQIDGAWLLAMHALGSLPAGPREYRQTYPATPRGVSSWPAVMYFEHRDGAWIAGGKYVYAVPEPLAALLAARHRDPSRVYLYAVKGLAVDETEPSQQDIDGYFRALPEMQKQLAAGTLMRVLN